MLSLILLFNFLLLLFFLYSFPTVNPLTLVNSSLYLCLLLSFLLQSKHKEDAPVTYPILLDEPESEVCLLPFFLLFLFFCTYFLCHMPLVVSSPFQHHHKLWIPLFLILPSFFFLSSRISPSLSPYTTSQLRRFLPPWAHPWEVSLMGLM